MRNRCRYIIFIIINIVCMFSKITYALARNTMMYYDEKLTLGDKRYLDDIMVAFRMLNGKTNWSLTTQENHFHLEHKPNILLSQIKKK